MATRVTGGRRLKQFIRQARRAQAKSIGQVEIGFFETARYPPVHTGQNGGRAQTPHHVATVAAWNEFGTRSGVPERPFFRQAIEACILDVRMTIRESINPETMAPDARLGGLVGEIVKGHIQQSITDLREPANAPSTTALKGSSNPLIDTGKMRQSVTWTIGG